MPYSTDQGGRHVVLSGQRVGRAQGEFRPARLERAHEAGGLAGHVQARADADARQRLLLLEPFPDHGQDRHLFLGPFDPEDARLGQAHVLHVMCDHPRLLLSSLPAYLTSTTAATRSPMWAATMTGATNSELTAAQPKRAAISDSYSLDGPVVRHPSHHTADYYHTVLCAARRQNGLGRVDAVHAREAGSHPVVVRAHQGRAPRKVDVIGDHHKAARRSREPARVRGKAPIPAPASGAAPQHT